MKKFFLMMLLLTTCFWMSCAQSDESEAFGECVLGSVYDELTQDEYTTYLQEAYGLDTLLSHQVYHGNGNFQVDFKFSKDVEDWQITSAKKFAVDKFYTQDVAKYDLWNYDVWLIEHLDQKSISVTYRIFIESKLTDSGVYPEPVSPMNEEAKIFDRVTDLFARLSSRV